MFRVIAKNTVSQLIGRAIGSLSMIAVSLLIARRFGSEGYGDFVKITTYVGFFYLFADYGLNAIAIQRTDSVWKVLLGLRLFMGVVLSVVSIGIISIMPHGFDQGYTDLVRLGIYLLTPAIVVQAVITTANAYFQKKLRYDYSAAAQVAGAVVMVITAFTLSTGPLIGVISLLVGGIVTMLVSLGIIAVEIRDVRPVVRMSEYRSLFTTATPLGLALIFNLVYFHADSVILALTRSTQEVGIYGLAYKVFELPLVVPIFFMNATYPILLKTQHKKRVFTTSLAFLFASSVCIAVAFWALAPLVIYIKPEFIQSVDPLRILLIGLPVFFVSGLYMWYMISQNLLKQILIIHGVAMTVNIVANIIFVPTYGFMAAAWITIVSELLVLIASVVTLGRRGI